jgi:hypothetical protein
MFLILIAPIGEGAPLDMILHGMFLFIHHRIGAVDGEGFLDNGLILLGVPFTRLSVANFGRLAFNRMYENRPSGVMVTNPLGRKPKGSIFLPSCSTYTETRVRLPWTCFTRVPAFSLSQAVEVPDHIPPERTATTSNAIATFLINKFMMFLLLGSTRCQVFLFCASSLVAAAPGKTQVRQPHPLRPTSFCSKKWPSALLRVTRLWCESLNMAPLLSSG